MRSPARAIAWEFRQRHRWGLIALAGYLLVLGLVRLLILDAGQPLRLDPPNGMAGAVIAPISITYFYLLAVFSFGLAGDLAARQSIYPPRMFVLPVTTAGLAGWPMLYGTVAAASLWLITALLARWLGGIALPLLWPALLAAVFLAWTQVLTWLPYGLPGARVIAAVLWLIALDTTVLLAIHFEVREPVMVSLLAPQLPLAYLAARYGVARARRGDVPDWRPSFSGAGQSAEPRPRHRHPFPSAGRAQAWFEWRRQGRSLPAWVGLLLPFELGLLFVASNDTPALVFYTLLGVLLTPPFMAAFVALTASKADPAGRDGYGVTPFTATRPVTSAELIAAKLTMTIWSTLAAWLLVCLAIPLGLSLSGTWPVVIERATRTIDAVGAPRAIVLLLLVLSGLMAATWKQQVQSLFIGLTGRVWLIRASLFLLLSLVVIIGPVVQWIHDSREAQAALWVSLPWIPAVLVCVKMTAAGWVATRLYQSRLLSDRALVTGAACWTVTVLALYGVLVWLVDTPMIPRHLLLFLAILAVPLARLSAAPLALGWNRHR